MFVLLLWCSRSLSLSFCFSLLRVVYDIHVLDALNLVLGISILSVAQCAEAQVNQQGGSFLLLNW